MNDRVCSIATDSQELDTLITATMIMSQVKGLLNTLSTLLLTAMIVTVLQSLFSILNVRGAFMWNHSINVQRH